MNIEFAQKVIGSVMSQGVRDFCLCPGARNAAFVEVLGQLTNVNVQTFFDERSAAFFALGRARRDRRPVAVVTTSGTAVAELLPATIEAFYTRTPLVLITADRPKRLRSTGAPQAIEQSNLLRQYVEKRWDLSPMDAVEFNFLHSVPYHINACFDEPMLDAEVNVSGLKVDEPKFYNDDLSVGPTLPVFQKTLIVVGALEKSERGPVAKVLDGLDVPQFYEASSGLRSHPKLEKHQLLGGEKIVSQILRSGEVETVIRIGDVPLGRFWRDLDLMDLTIYSFSNKPFAGTDKSKIHRVDFSDWQGIRCEDWDWSRWMQRGKQKAQQVAELFEEFPLSEVSFFKKFHDSLAPEESLYLGNSLPIRLWDLVSEKNRGFRSNRGANGIDGQLSSALGWMKPSSQNKVVLGDLTSLYDFNGFWVTPQLKADDIDVELIVVNNGGGKIFSRIFKNPMFQNNHHLNFQPIGDFWGWNHTRVEDPSVMRPFHGLSITEWVPDPAQSTHFWERYDQLWQK